MIDVFIGYDPVEAGAYHTLVHSIHSRCSQPVRFTPVSLSNLKGWLTRSRHPMQSNDFSFSRFLVPWMCDFKGYAIFMDCDMVVTDDISKIWALRDDKAVKVVKHSHQPTEKIKYLGNEQTRYDRKNWSSFMLFNNEKCKNLSLDYINVADGLDLHQFKWLDDREIGELPKQWNFLVGYDAPKELPANIHYTSGGPYFSDYAQCDYANEWWTENRNMNYIKGK